MMGFLHEVREEVLKCTRPSYAELQESTTVVVATMAILGLFILGCDYAISFMLGPLFNT